MGAVGIATLFFGFLAGALFNVYLVATGDPLVQQLRTVLSYRSAILGDGLLLPIANMAAAAALAKRQHEVSRPAVLIAILFGVTITGCVHAFQATHELVNWSMPTPWHWNAIGLWHAAYMGSVISWLALFLLVMAKSPGRQMKSPEKQGLCCSACCCFCYCWASTIARLISAGSDRRGSSGLHVARTVSR